MSALRISAVTVTPVAFADPPLLNSVGVHEPFALRAVVEVSTDGGLSGLGETYTDERHLAALCAAADAIVGANAYHTEQIYRRVQAIAAPDTPIASGLIGDSSATDRVFSPFEVACLDIQGQAAGRPVADLLGGAVRDEVPFSAYLFYKWAAHPGAEPDGWGEALDPDGIVAQARRMVGQYGFTALKLKGGVFPPDQEAEAIRALRLAFPDHPLRLDPNAAWTEDTSVAVARDLDGVLEYLEDPTAGIDGMARVARLTPMPLATNMCVVAFAHLPPAIRARAVQVVLSDHHYWGGLRRDNRSSLAGILAASGSALDIATAWGVIGVFVRQAAFGAPTREADVETRIGVPPGVLRPFYREIVSAGYLTRSSDGVLELTERGQAEADKLVAAWKAWLMGELRDWLAAHEVSPAQASEVGAALGRITLRLVREAEAEAGRTPVALGQAPAV